MLSDVNVSITCPSGGIPIPEVTWKRGDAQLGPGGRFGVSKRELNISNVVTGDTGRYVCLVNNVMGQISRGSNLNVLGE